jgi:hypothetical protein
MLTYLEDVDRYDHWNGSAWVSPFGMTLVNTTSFSSATTVSVNNVFSSAYNNYKIFLRVSGSSVNGTDINMRTRAGGVDFSSNLYLRAVYYLGITSNTSLQGFPNQTSNFTSIANTSDLLGVGAEVTVFSPFLSDETVIKSTSSGSLVYETSAIINASNSFDGFTIYPSSGNMTGTLRVYGLRN